MNVEFGNDLMVWEIQRVYKTKLRCAVIDSISPNAARRGGGRCSTMYLKHLPCCSTHPPQMASLLPNHQPSLDSRAISISQTYPYIFPSNVNLHPREIYALHISRLRNLAPPLRSQLYASPSIHPLNDPPGKCTLDVDTTDPTPSIGPPAPRLHGAEKFPSLPHQKP